MNCDTSSKVVVGVTTSLLHSFPIFSNHVPSTKAALAQFIHRLIDPCLSFHQEINMHDDRRLFTNLYNGREERQLARSPPGEMDKDGSVEQPPPTATMVLGYVPAPAFGLVRRLLLHPALWTLPGQRFEGRYGSTPQSGIPA